jgi:ArsR family transcriptional regulator
MVDAAAKTSPAPGKPDLLIARMASLADPTRLRLLRLLERHELGVADLCDILQLPQSTVSRHLKVLLDQRWVRSRRQATNHLYRTILDELDAPARKLWLLAREQTDAWPTVEQDRLRLSERLRARETSSEAFFAGAAAEWDRLRDELYGRGFTHAATLALLPPETVVADLGCGTASVAAQLAPHVKRVIGVDNSAAMLKAAAKRTADFPNVDLRRGDLSALPIDAATCDAALLLLALTYVPEPATVLAEVRRPGGRVVIVDLLPHDRDDFRRQMGQLHAGFEPSDLEAALRVAGFSSVSSSGLPPEQGVKGPALFLTVATAGATAGAPSPTSPAAGGDA